MAEQSWLDRLETTQAYQRLRYSMNRQLVSFFKKRVLTGKSSFRVAEVACGSGYASHLLAQESSVSMSLASDVSLQDHRQAKIEGYAAAFILMDLFKPSLIPASMDLVWNSSSIEEIERPDDAIVAMVWLAKPGGLVFVGVPYKYGPAGLLHLFSGHREKTWLGRTYDRKGLQTLMKAANLKIEDQIFYFGGVFIGILGRKPTDLGMPHC